jgi:hypothetical protein
MARLAKCVLVIHPTSAVGEFACSYWSLPCHSGKCTLSATPVTDPWVNGPSIVVTINIQTLSANGGIGASIGSGTTTTP